MKKLLIVYNTLRPKLSHLEMLANELGPSYQLGGAVLVDFMFWVKAGTLKVSLGPRQDIRQYDGVFFAKWMRFQIAAAVATYLKTHKVAFKPSEVGDFPPVNKLGEAALLADHDLPLPDSLIASTKNILQHPEAWQSTLRYPLIAKHVDASFGNDNYLVADFGELKQKLSGYDQNDFFILQQYIANDGDYRCLVLNGQAKVLINRIRSNSSQHLNNTRKGARGEVVADIPAAFKELSEKAAKLTGRDQACARLNG